MYYTKKYSLNPVVASIRMILATAATKNEQLRHFDVKVKADIDEEIYIEISAQYQEFPGAARRRVV